MEAIVPDVTATPNPVADENSAAGQTAEPLKTTVTVEEILAAAATYQRFAGEERIGPYRSTFRHLPGIIGSERLGALVSQVGLMEIISSVIDHLVAEGFAGALDLSLEDLRRGRTQMIALLPGFPELLEAQGVTEERAFLGLGSQLDEACRNLWGANRLTYAELASRLPWIFFPAPANN
jgi:hypothetical protein